MKKFVSGRTDLSAESSTCPKRWQKLSAGNLNYLSEHPDINVHHGDKLEDTTSGLQTLFRQLDHNFHSISQDANNLNTTSINLGHLSQKINDNVRLNRAQTQQVIESAMTVREAIVKMSDDVSNMSEDIGNIEDSASHASVVANEAVVLGKSTDAIMRKLSADIDNVVKLINTVAELTNLLALNATIEAARAGDAGKGFGVVAYEVKELAKQANKATDEIQKKIDTIRGDTNHAVTAIGNINNIVGQINEIQIGITKLVKNQSQSADGITRLVLTTLDGNKKVRGLLAEISERQRINQASAIEIQDASKNLLLSASDNLELTARYT